MSDSRTLILDHQQIEQKINRIAFQIYEDHYDQNDLIIAGIAENGYVLAELITDKIQEISKISIDLIRLEINKKNPLSEEVMLHLDANDLNKRSIIVVDDVLNSGKTMMYGLQPFLKSSLKKLSTAVLVNRSHNRFPVHANYVGMSLATTLKEHIEVSLQKNSYAAYLI